LVVAATTPTPMAMTMSTTVMNMTMGCRSLCMFAS
jgi:hypothetical protein